jgi:hypothetical protein
VVVDEPIVPSVESSVDLTEAPTSSSATQPVLDPPSPVHAIPQSLFNAPPTDEYASPAFLKRARVSYGSLFEGGLDVSEDDGGPKGRGRKRTKFGRPSNAWRYTSQSRSPEPEQTVAEVELATYEDEGVQSSPPRPQMLDEGVQTVELDMAEASNGLPSSPMSQAHEVRSRLKQAPVAATEPDDLSISQPTSQLRPAALAMPATSPIANGFSLFGTPVSQSTTMATSVLQTAAAAPGPAFNMLDHVGFSFGRSLAAPEPAAVSEHAAINSSSAGHAEAWPAPIELLGAGNIGPDGKDMTTSDRPNNALDEHAAELVSEHGTDPSLDPVHPGQNGAAESNSTILPIQPQIPLQPTDLEPDSNLYEDALGPDEAEARGDQSPSDEPTPAEQDQVPAGLMSYGEQTTAAVDDESESEESEEEEDDLVDVAPGGPHQIRTLDAVDDLEDHDNAVDHDDDEAEYVDEDGGDYDQRNYYDVQDDEEGYEEADEENDNDYDSEGFPQGSRQPHDVDSELFSEEGQEGESDEFEDDEEEIDDEDDADGSHSLGPPSAQVSAQRPMITRAAQPEVIDLISDSEDEDEPPMKPSLNKSEKPSPATVTAGARLATGEVRAEAEDGSKQADGHNELDEELERELERELEQELDEELNEELEEELLEDVEKHEDEHVEESEEINVDGEAEEEEGVEEDSSLDADGDEDVHNVLDLEADADGDSEKSDDVSAPGPELMAAAVESNRDQGGKQQTLPVEEPAMDVDDSADYSYVNDATTEGSQHHGMVSFENGPPASQPIFGTGLPDAILEGQAIAPQGIYETVGFPLGPIDTLDQHIDPALTSQEVFHPRLPLSVGENHDLTVPNVPAMEPITSRADDEIFAPIALSSSPVVPAIDAPTPFPAVAAISEVTEVSRPLSAQGQAKLANTAEPNVRNSILAEPSQSTIRAEDNQKIPSFGESQTLLGSFDSAIVTAKEKVTSEVQPEPEATLDSSVIPATTDQPDVLNHPGQLRETGASDRTNGTQLESADASQVHESQVLTVAQEEATFHEPAPELEKTNMQEVHDTTAPGPLQKPTEMPDEKAPVDHVRHGSITATPAASGTVTMTSESANLIPTPPAQTTADDQLSTQAAEARAEKAAESEATSQPTPPVSPRRRRAKTAHTDPSIQFARAAAAQRHGDGLPIKKGKVSGAGRRRSKSIQRDANLATHDTSVELARGALRSPSRAVSHGADWNNAQAAATLKNELTERLKTDVPDGVPLKNLRLHMGKHLSVTGIVTSEPAAPRRTKTREYAMSFNVTDLSIAPTTVVEVNFYHPHKDSLPIVKPGDGIFLREFQVVAAPKKEFILRTHDASSWAVFDAEDGSYQVRGPPIELTEAEVAFMNSLRKWFSILGDEAKAKVGKANQKFAEASAMKPVQN